MGILSVPRYTTAQDVQLRLNKTDVLYRGRPVWVGQNLNTPTEGPNDLILDVFDLLDQKWVDRVHSSDEELEVKSQPLGYFNQEQTNFRNPVNAVYAARLPCRRQRQGLSQENCHIFLPTPTPNGVTTDNIGQNQLKSRAFGLMMTNDYPSFEDCLKQLRDKTMCKSRAFGRKLLITEDEIGLIKLHYFTVAIGVWNPRKKRFSLPEQFEHYMPIMKSHDVPCEVFE